MNLNNSNNSNISSTNIIESELYRKKLYQFILDNINEKLKKHLLIKEVQHFMLRYVFNKIIERRDYNDPIFIPEYSDICYLQVQKDFEFKNIQIDVNEFVKYIDELLKDADNKMKDTVIENDKPIYYDKNLNSFFYNNKYYKNISNLGNYKNPEFYPYCIALNIRYSYLHLSTHGLAREYYKMGYSKSDGFEIFASSFNHYFDFYHSAFPDLEKPFGSLGSFFSSVEPCLLKCAIYNVIESIKNNKCLENAKEEFKENGIELPFFLSDIYKNSEIPKKNYYKSSKNRFKNKVMFVNPPFDMVLMSVVFFIFEHLNIEYKTIFTVPNWSNFLFLDKIKKHIRTKKTIIYPKGQLCFINHMNNRRIYPCDIAEIYLLPDL